MDLRKCADSVTIDVRRQHKPENAFIPAVSDHDLYLIFLPDHFRDIVDLILQPVMITCPSRRHPICSDAFSVQIRFIDASGRGINSGFLYLSFCCKCPGKNRTCCLILRKVMCDHFCLKCLRFQNSCLKRHFTCRCIAMIVGCCHRYLIKSLVPQFFSCIRNQNRLLTLRFRFPYDLFIRSYYNMIRLLYRVSFPGFQFPRKTRMLLCDPDRIHSVFCSQIIKFHIVVSSLIS